MHETQIISEFSISAIESLENYFRNAGSSLVRAAFAHTYFVHPDKVRERTPFFDDRARFSRVHYPGLVKGEYATWNGDGRTVRLDDNQYAQNAWERYTGTRIARGSGYGLRHIWGHTWDPEAFTAGWNFCYMPFWAGMLTEKQHSHSGLEPAIRQAAWDLYFRDNPVCRPPDFVGNPGIDLESMLEGQPLRIMRRDSVRPVTRPAAPRTPRPETDGTTFDKVKAIRRQANQSWVNIRKASRLLQGKEYDEFGTRNVENSSKSIVRKMKRETGLSFVEIEALLDEHGLG